MSPSRPRLSRTVALVLAVLWVVLAFVVGSFFTYPSERLGWLWAALVFGVGLVGCALIWPSATRVTVGLAVGVSLLLGLLDWQSSPPTHDRIAAVADDTDLPDDWRLESEWVRGNTWCWKGCPEVERTYTVPGPYAAARDEAVARLEEDGWDVDGDQVVEGYVALSDGRWEVVISEDGDSDAAGITLSFS